MAQIKGLNAHDKPSEAVRQCFKKYSKAQPPEIDHDSAILDLQRMDPAVSLPANLSLSHYISSQELRLAFDDFIRGRHSPLLKEAPMMEDIPVFKHNGTSGLLMIPSLFPPTVQTEMLSRLLHRDLSNPENRTNLHLHYDVTYPERDEDDSVMSFFGDDPTRVLQPKNAQTHGPLDIQTVLEKKLRWVALGGQSDQTDNVDSPEAPPEFPPDVAKLLMAAFPEIEARGATLNIHSAGDTMSAHRDASEDCDSGLISVGFGCDGLFIVSHDDGNGAEVVRLRSGDAVYMNEKARFAWHGLSKILPSTCPTWLADWPSIGENAVGNVFASYEMWKGWISGKRINLNVHKTEMSNACEDSISHASDP